MRYIYGKKTNVNHVQLIGWCLRESLNYLGTDTWEVESDGFHSCFLELQGTFRSAHVLQEGRSLSHYNTPQ